jgi:para-aminobenzoate synthetase component I
LKKYDLKEKFEANDLLKLCSYFASDYGTCLLYSGGNFEGVKQSYLFLFPFETFTVAHSSFLNKYSDFKNVIVCDDVFKLLNQKITDHFWSGFLSYELGAFSDKNERAPFISKNIPLAYFQRCLVVLEYHHQSSKMTIYQEDFDKTNDLRHLQYAKKIINLKQFLAEIPVITKPSIEPAICLHQEEKKSYLKKINTVQALIESGNVYQINLSHEIKLKTTKSYFDVFYNLTINNPSPFSAYFYLNKTAIISNSPERLLKKEGSLLETKPIKGTIKRGNTKSDDIANILKLTSSEKENAELVMITDLLRNDLAKVSEIGSIVTKLNQVEKYENLTHMLSIIRSKANLKLSNVEILREIFPGGSITGCPKIEAKKVIYQLEKRERGIYTGSIGYFKGFQDFDFNICIRTILFNEDVASLQLGGAIVADSDPIAEYLETLIKGKSLFKALNYTSKA